MPDFTEILDYVLAFEGGYSDNPADKGGATNYGVTQKTYDFYRDKKGESPKAVSSITIKEAQEIYRSMYWNVCQCDRLPWPVNFFVFDCAVNSGPRTSVKLLQRAIGLVEDGLIGPKTLKRAGEIVDQGDLATLLRIPKARIKFISGIIKNNPSQLVFLNGWMNRIVDMTALGLATE